VSSKFDRVLHPEFGIVGGRCSYSCDERGEMNSSQEIPSELVVSCGDAPEVFEPAKAALDDISAFIVPFVEAMDDDTVGFIGDPAIGASSCPTVTLKPAYRAG
jgi:hypothetical protein